MIEIKPYIEHAVLVGLITPSQPEDRTKEYLDELAFLADTHGIVPVKRFTQRLDQPNTATYVGEGKLEEIRQYIIKNEELKIKNHIIYCAERSSILFIDFTAFSATLLLTFISGHSYFRQL